MKIKIQQFLFGKKSHSWSFVGRNLAKAFIKNGHAIDLISTDGVIEEFIPTELKNYVKQSADHDYEMQISYTAPHNFPRYLSSGKNNRFGIYAYEFPILPKGFAKYYHYTDKILAPSSFVKDIFVNAGVPQDHVSVIPHGVDLDNFDSVKYPLKTTKSFKFLMVIGQSHARKNIANAIEAFYKSFTKNDDVCLVAKIVVKKPTSAFEVDVNEIFKSLNTQYPEHPEVELISDFVPNIIHLHNACQVIYSLTYAEGFYLPALDGLFAGNLVICPRYGGQLDFCNDENSLLIDGKLIRAPLEMQYYQSDLRNSIFAADMDQTIEILRKAFGSFDQLNSKFQKNFENSKGKYLWTSVAKEIEDLCSNE